MGWATDTAAAAVEAFEGVFGEGVTVAGVAIDETGTAVSLSDGWPVDARFEIGYVTKTMTAAGKEYPARLEERVFGPLGMTDSGVGPAGDGTPLPGYANGRRVTRWEQPLPGTGGVETSAGDFARYLGACLVPPDSSLGAAI